jgi:hypothetical protein
MKTTAAVDASAAVRAAAAHVPAATMSSSTAVSATAAMSARYSDWKGHHKDGHDEASQPTGIEH